MNGMITAIKENLVARKEAIIGAAIGATATLAVGFGIKAVKAAKNIVASEDAEEEVEEAIEEATEETIEEATDSIE